MAVGIGWDRQVSWISMETGLGPLEARCAWMGGWDGATGGQGAASMSGMAGARIAGWCQHGAGAYCRDVQGTDCGTVLGLYCHCPLIVALTQTPPILLLDTVPCPQVSWACLHEDLTHCVQHPQQPRAG